MISNVAFITIDRNAAASGTERVGAELSTDDGKFSVLRRTNERQSLLRVEGDGLDAVTRL